MKSAIRAFNRTILCTAQTLAEMGRIELPEKHFGLIRSKVEQLTKNMTVDNLNEMSNYPFLLIAPTQASFQEALEKAQRATFVVPVVSDPAEALINHVNQLFVSSLKQECSKDMACASIRFGLTMQQIKEFNELDLDQLSYFASMASLRYVPTKSLPAFTNDYENSIQKARRIVVGLSDQRIHAPLQQAA